MAAMWKSAVPTVSYCSEYGLCSLAAEPAERRLINLNAYAAYVMLHCTRARKRFLLFLPEQGLDV
jgi:hypothetical protein